MYDSMIIQDPNDAQGTSFNRHILIPARAATLLTVFLYLEISGQRGTIIYGRHLTCTYCITLMLSCGDLRPRIASHHLPNSSNILLVESLRPHLRIHDIYCLDCESSSQPLEAPRQCYNLVALPVPTYLQASPHETTSASH